MSDKWTKRVEDKSSVFDYTETHPSYGVISISHTSGRTDLFASDVQHQHFITIKVSEARRVVNGTHEFVMDDRQLVEVAMSAAQFAEFITSPNRGSGTPCTIRNAAGDQPYEGVRWGRPNPPRPEPFLDKFKREGRERMELMVKHMEYAKELAEALVIGISKPTKENLKGLTSSLTLAIQEIRSNMPFVITQLDEATEKRMQTAVTEFESYLGTRLQTLGLEHLQSQVPRLNAVEAKALPEPEKES